MQIGLDTTGVASGEFLQPFEIHTWEAPVIISQIQRNNIAKLYDKYSTCNVMKLLFELFR